MLMSGLGVMAVALIALWFGSRLYMEYYESMHAYRMDGLPFMVLFAWGIATLVTPFFAFAMSQNPDDAPKNALEVLKIYVVVWGVFFVCLTVVFFLLWILGWLYVLSYVAYRWFLDLIGLGD